MKYFFTLSILAFSTLLFSCNKKNHSLTVTENKIVGQYRFEKVVVEQNIFKREDITGEYSDMILQLNDKKQAAIIDNTTGITITGFWDMSERYNTNTYSDDNTTTNVQYTLNIEVSGARGQDMWFYSDDATISAHKLQFKTHRADGDYIYKLEKL